MNKTGIVGVTSKFIVNEKKRIVTCIVSYSRLKYAPYVSTPDYRNLTIDESPKKFIGIARCNIKDTFNYEIGRRIAESKAKSIMYKYVSKLYEDFLAKVLDMNFFLGEIADNCKYCSIAEKKHVEDIIYNLLRSNLTSL